MPTTSDVRGEVKGTLKLTKRTASVLSASTYNTALAMPAVAKEAPETNVTSGLLGIATGGRGKLDLQFCAVGAAGKDYPYQVIGWRHGKTGIGSGFIPEKVATGSATLGTQTLAAAGAWLDKTTDGTGSRWADTLTETLASGYASVNSPVDNTVARLTIDVSSFIYITVRVTLSGASSAPTSMTVVANLGDLVAGTTNSDGDVDLGDVDLVSGGNAMTRLGTNNDAASLTGSQAAQLRSLGIALGGEETLYEHFSAVVNQAAGANLVIKAGTGSKQIWVYGWLVHAGVAAGTYQWLSATTPKTGECPVGVNGGAAPAAGRGSGPIFKCVTSEDLKLTTVTCAIDGVIWGFVVTV